jgi:hypothetical protein
MMADGMFSSYERQYHRNDSIEHISDWYALEEGEYYYFEIYFYQYGGAGYMSIGVEIE